MKKIITSLLFVALFSCISAVAHAGNSTDCAGGGTPVPTVPDVGNTSSLVVIAVGGLAMLRRFVR